MSKFYENERLALHHGDCRTVMATFYPASIDAIVTDPPYDLTAGKKGGTGEASVNESTPAGRARISTGFMGKAWDGTGVAFEAATWAEALRILKPGGHLVAFGAPRTYHRLACAIEDAGFEIRDCVQWLFGSGFPKSLNLHDEWEGWGTALKPAYEPIVVARKPLSGTVADNVGSWGTGALNIDGCRIDAGTRPRRDAAHTVDYQGWGGMGGSKAAGEYSLGRWPANVCLDQEAAATLDSHTGATGASGPIKGTEPTADGFSGPVYGTQKGRQAAPFYGDTGGASRFFYTAKTSTSEREFGLEDLDLNRRSDGREKDIENPRLRTNERRNDHPTVKPVDLMAWLCRLVTPPGGLVLDPFLGSGSTGMAALDEGFLFVGIDMEEHYLEIARRRITRRHALEPLPQRDEGQGVLL